MDWSLKIHVQPLWMALSAFTMAEILLSLTIIGVVAAITLPSLTGNINERTWNTQRKALYARMSQAIALMPALNGYGTLRESTDSAGSTSIEDTAAETFITNGLAKVLKINNICDSEHLEDCGITSKITAMNGSVKSLPTTLKDLNNSLISVDWTYPLLGNRFSYSAINTKAVAFETANGESIIAYYNPKCLSKLGETSYILWPKLCVNFIYDFNGTKGPNTIGKDMGIISVLYPTDSSVVVLNEIKYAGQGNWETAIKMCRNLDDEYRFPNNDELVSFMINRQFINNNAYTVWSSTVDEKNRPYYMWQSGYLQPHTNKNSGSAAAYCIKR